MARGGTLSKMMALIFFRQGHCDLRTANRKQRGLRKPCFLPNYPNPFNPETWIPYDLAQDAEVHVHIYNLKGESVRRLSLGFPNGWHLSHTTALLRIGMVEMLWENLSPVVSIFVRFRQANSKPHVEW